MKKSLSKILTIAFVGVLSLTLVLNTNPIAGIMADEENTKEEVETTNEEVETKSEESSVEADEPIDVSPTLSVEQAAFKSLAIGMSSRASLAKDQWTGHVTKMFPEWNATVNGSTTGTSNPLDLVNINASVLDSKWVYYDAKAGVGLPSSGNTMDNLPLLGTVASRYTKRQAYQFMGNYPVSGATEQINAGFNANWSIKLKVKAPMTTNQESNVVRIFTNITDTGSANDPGGNLIFELGTNITQQNGSKNAYMSFWKKGIPDFGNGFAPQAVYLPAGYFDTEQEVILKNVYNAAANSFTYTMSTGGKTVTYSDTLINTNYPNFATNKRISNQFYMHAAVGWGKTMGWTENTTLTKNYPTGIESYVAFDDTSLIYENFNPMFESIVWRDAAGTVLDTNSVVNVGDKLTVTANMKNDINTKDQIPSRLLTSSDTSKTFGITSDLPDVGSRYLMLNENVPVTMTTTVLPEAVGKNVTIGLRSKDGFFSREIFGESTGPRVGTDVAQTSEIKVMELARDGNGNVLKDGANFRFVEADNQTMLTQDSFIKVEGTLTNKRLSENIDLKLKLDSSSALGFDFANIRNLMLTNGTGSASDMSNGTGLNFTIPMKGTSSYSFILPVKQSAVGKPFNVDEQKLKYAYDSSYTIAGVATTASWSDEEVVSNTTLRPIKDVDMELTTSDVSLERGQTFELLNETGSLLAFTGSNGGTTDWSKLRLQHQGVAADWAKFGLATNSVANGTVGAFVPDGTTMKTIVSYNEVLQLNGKAYYTRKGGTQEETPRTKTKEINLTVNGGTISPEGFVDIPSFVGLKDANGIDSKHAGEKATVKLKDHAPAGVDFEISGDTDFLVSDAKESYVVSLYHENKVEMSKVNKKATVTTLNDANKSKVVWYNTPMDVKKVGSYLGTMTFYIKVN